MSHLSRPYKIVGLSDAVEESTPTKSSFSAWTPGFYVLSKDNCKTRWETVKFWDLVQLILEIWRYMCECISVGRVNFLALYDIVLLTSIFLNCKLYKNYVQINYCILYPVFVLR